MSYWHGDTSSPILPERSSVPGVDNPAGEVLVQFNFVSAFPGLAMP